MAKDKKSKKKDKKKSGDKKPGVSVAAKTQAKGKAKKQPTRLKELSQNPLVADVVAAALVATVAALKDSKKAQQLAAAAGDELEALAKSGVKRGGVMWQLALDVGRQAIDALGGEKSAGKKPAKTAKK